MSIQIRNALACDAASLARVHVNGWQTSYRGIVLDAYLDRLSYADCERFWDGKLENRPANATTLVAQRENEVIGFGFGGPSREGSTMGAEAELYALYVNHDVRGSGVGTRLLRSMAESLSASGPSKMRVWVLRENSRARRFYERCGAIYCEERIIEIGHVALPECLYVWTDVGRLVAGG